MSSYLWAWVVLAGSALLGLFALRRAVRGLFGRRLTGALTVLLLVWALLPAPVPGYDGHYAPAFLVFAFEWLFQQGGNPRPAGLILAAGTAAALALLLVMGLLRRNR